MIITQLKHLYGIGPTLANRIRKELGDGQEWRAVERVAANPYVLMDVDGIGFKKADYIAIKQFDLPLNSKARAFWGNQSILEQEGSMLEDKYIQQQRTLGLDCLENRFEGVTVELGRIWLPGVLEAEKGFADWYANLIQNDDFVLSDAQIAQYMPLLEGLDPVQQKAALYMALSEDTPLLGLIGGAGTGKTRVIAAACQVAKAAGIKVTVLAFAGKAADRIRESLDLAGAVAELTGTIHRALGFVGGKFSKGLSQKLVILDESSMIPTVLLWAVVRALPTGARLVLVGDEGQLSPIGHGQPFKDVLALGAPHYELVQNYRQKDVLGIIEFAGAVRQHTRYSEPVGCISLHASADIGNFCDGVLTRFKAMNLEEWQVLTWKGEDCEEANTDLQSVINPHGMPLYQGRDNVEIRAGDKIMVKQNSYTYSIFNGQLGVAESSRLTELVDFRKAVTLDDWAIANEDGFVEEKRLVECIQVRISGEIIDIPLDEAPDLLKLGYAITVHKSQGSDWDEVLIYQPRSVAYSSNNWWYTAVTRAKNHLHIAFTSAYAVKVKNVGKDFEGAFWQNATAFEKAAPSTLLGRVRKIWNEQRLEEGAAD